MNSKLLENIGLVQLDIGYLFLGIAVVILVLLLLLIVQFIQTNKLKKHLTQFIRGKEGASLEEILAKIVTDNEYLRETSEENRKSIKKINKNLESCFQKSGVLKYDAFQQMGGKLSFSIALLDEKNNGFILNSVHSTDGCYSYTKTVTRGICELALGEEEKIALELAMGEKRGKV